MTRIRTHLRAATAVVALVVAAPSLVAAQTPLGSKPAQGQAPARTIGQPEQPALSTVPTTPPGKSPPAPTTPTAIAPAQVPAQQPQQAAQAAKVPMSGASYTQALYQSEGEYNDMQRPGAGGQIQEAWDKVETDDGTGQSRQGVYTTRVCEDCVYKVRAREMMTTTLVLPEDAVIGMPPDVGDPRGFAVQVKSANMIAVRPSMYGVDTNLTVFTKAGRTYPFYIRAESYNSKFVPDLVVKIVGREKPETIKVPDFEPAEAGTTQVRQEKGTASAKPGDKTAAAIHDLTNPAPPTGDFVRNVPFDPSKLKGWRDYKLWGDSGMQKPTVIYRDDFFTYIQYGEKFDELSLPTAYVTIDGIDELVNTRVQGSTLIVESVEPLITLKNGKKHLCIQYTGERS